MYIVVLILLILVGCVVIEHMYWNRILLSLREYIQPIVSEYGLSHVPVGLRYFGAVTVNKERITMCVRYHYSIPQLSYVLLHEYAHVLTVSVGHTDEFWGWFAKILATAESMDIFVDDYFNTHKYCPR